MDLLKNNFQICNYFSIFSVFIVFSPEIFITGNAVDVSGVVFGIDDDLIMIESAVARQHVADHNGDDHEIRSSGEAEKLKADQHGCYGAVGDPAKKGQHAGCRAQGRGYSCQMSENTAECCTGEEGRNDLASFVAGTQGQRGEKNLEEKGKGRRFSRNRPVDHRGSGSAIHPRPQCQGESNDDAASGEYPEIGVFKILPVEEGHIFQKQAENNGQAGTKHAESNHLGDILN